MVLGDQAYDRGAWANRIGETEAGIGYLFGEGIREPLRVRAGWVSDETIKELEAFVTGPTPAAVAPGKVLALPAPTPRRPPSDRRRCGLMTPELATNAATTDAAPGLDETPVVDPDQLTRAQKALLTLTGDVARQLAEDHGVCVRPLAMRRIDLTTGRVEVVPVPCGSRREDLCPPCAEKQRRLRMTQCREGWHLDHEPMPARPAPTAAQKQMLAVRAELHAAYLSARHDDDQDECEAIRETVAVVDDQLRRMGVTGRLAPLDGERRDAASGPPGGGRTHRTCPAARSSTAPSAAPTRAATAPRRSSR